MESELQKNLLALFHYSLKNGAILLLGTAESASTQNNLFLQVDAKLRIYRRTNAPMVIDVIDFPK